MFPFSRCRNTKLESGQWVKQPLSIQRQKFDPSKLSGEERNTSTPYEPVELGPRRRKENRGDVESKNRTIDDGNISEIKPRSYERNTPVSKDMFALLDEANDPRHGYIRTLSKFESFIFG